MVESVRHPWDKWFKKIRGKGKKLLLKRGKDYDCMTHSMSIQLRNAAKQRGIRISCQTREEGEAIEIKEAK